MTEPYKGPQDPRLQDIQDAYDQRFATDEERELACKQYADESDNDIEIDDNAKVAEIEGSKNIWVQAWVYVRVKGDEE